MLTTRSRRAVLEYRVTLPKYEQAKNLGQNCQTIIQLPYVRERRTNESDETQTLGRFLNSRQTT